MDSDLVLPCKNSPVSASIPQSYGKRGDECSNCSTSCIFWGVPTTGASVLNVEICLLLFFGKSLLHMYRHNNIIIQVLRLVLFSTNLLGLQNQGAASKVKEFSTFLCMRRVTSLKSFPFICISPSGAGILYSPSWVSSGLTVESGCSLMAARLQVFSLRSFLRAHCEEWLQSDGCNKAGILLLPESLGN